MAHQDESLVGIGSEQDRKRLALRRTAGSWLRVAALASAFLLIVALAAGCEPQADTSSTPEGSVTESPESSESPEPAEPTEQPTEAAEEAEKADETAKKKPECPTTAPSAADTQGIAGKSIVMETSQGRIEIEFLPKDAPIHVAAFIKLAECGFYDGTKFHRVGPTQEAPDMVQGGDPNTKTGEGQPGQGGPGYTLPAEFNSNKHVDGTLSMARSQNPDSAGSQFYIAKSTLSFLDNNYTVFGQVTKGLDVVHKLAVGDSITKVTVVGGSK